MCTDSRTDSQFDLFPISALAETVARRCQELAIAVDRAAPYWSARDTVDLMGDLALVQRRVERANQSPLCVHAIPCLTGRWGPMLMSGRRAGTHIRVCGHCGRRFEQGRRDQVYCRDLCRYRAANARRQDLVNAGKLARAGAIEAAQ